MNKIKIANYLLTRKCNLKCDYCRIALSRFSDYILRPNKYPDKNYYIENEMDYSYWNDLSDSLIKHNQDVFFILYGGEPFLYNDIDKVINYLNEKNANYTIISSANNDIREKIINTIKSTGGVKGFSCSIDPGFYLATSNDRKELENDEIYKSINGFEFLKYLIKNKLVKDPVAEITVDKNNIKLLEETIKILSDNNITSSITSIDISKNNAYDFSSIDSLKSSIEQNDENYAIFNKLKNSKYKIHMKNVILDKLYKNLPCEYNCNLENDNLHNITVDSDGNLRLCLRIRGYNAKFKAIDIFNEDGSFSERFDLIYSAMKSDKSNFCEGCIWTCPMMSEEDSMGIINH